MKTFKGITGLGGFGRGRGKERRVSPFSLLMNQSLVSDCSIKFVLTILLNVDERSKNRIPSITPKYKNRRKFSAKWGDQLGKLVILEKKGEG